MLFLTPLPQRLDSGATPTFAGLLAGDGTAAAPSISFAADSDTGFYRVSANSIGISASGTVLASFALNGSGFRINGQNGIGAYVDFNGNGSFGITAQGNNQNITLTPSGSGSSVVDSVAGQELSVLFRQNGSTKGSLITSGGDVLFGTTGATNLIFTTSGAEKGRFFANGRFGIGTGSIDSANGILQLATHTTLAGGIGFGTETLGIYRSGTNTLAFTAGGNPFLWNGTVLEAGTWGSAITFKGTNPGAGNANRAGDNLLLQAGQSTGSGAGGSLVFQTSAAGGAGSALNAYTTALTLDSSQNATFAGNVSVTAVLSTTSVSGFGITAFSSTWANLGVGTAARSSLRIGHGAPPTSPVDGDMWTTTAGAFIRINGVIKTFTLT